MFFLEYVIKPPSTTRGGNGTHKKESCFKMDLEETIHDTPSQGNTRLVIKDLKYLRRASRHLVTSV